MQAARRAISLEFTQKRWLDRHPLTRAELEQEIEVLAAAQMRLRLL